MRIRETSDLGYTFIHGNKYMVVLVRKLVIMIFENKIEICVWDMIGWTEVVERIFK